MIHKKDLFISKDMSQEVDTRGESDDIIESDPNELYQTTFPSVQQQKPTGPGAALLVRSVQKGSPGSTPSNSGDDSNSSTHSERSSSKPTPKRKPPPIVIPRQQSDQPSPVFSTVQQQSSQITPTPVDPKGKYGFIMSIDGDFPQCARKWSQMNDTTRVGFGIFRELMLIQQSAKSTRTDTNGQPSSIIAVSGDIFIEQYTDPNGRYYYGWFIEISDKRPILTWIAKYATTLTAESKGQLDQLNNEESGGNGNDYNGRKRKRDNYSLSARTVCRDVRSWIWNYHKNSGELRDENGEPLTRENIYKENVDFTVDKISFHFQDYVYDNYITSHELRLQNRFEVVHYDDDLYMDMVFYHIDKKEISLVNLARKLEYLDPLENHGDFILNEDETNYIPKKDGRQITTKFITDFFDYVSTMKTRELLKLDNKFKDVLTYRDLEVYARSARQFYDEKISEFVSLLNPNLPDELTEYYQIPVKKLLQWYRTNGSYNGVGMLFTLISPDSINPLTITSWKPSIGESKWEYFQRYFCHSAEKHYHLENVYIPLFLIQNFGTLCRYNGEKNGKICLWVYGNGGSGKSRFTEIFKTLCPEGVTLDMDMDSSAQTVFSETRMGGFVFIMDESSTAFEGGKGGKGKSEESSKKEKEFKIGVTKGNIARSNFEFIKAIDTNGEKITTRASVTLVVNYNSIYIINSNYQYSQLAEPTKTRLLPYPVPRNYTDAILENIMVDRCNEFCMDETKKMFEAVMKSIHFVVMLSEKGIFMRYTPKPSDLVAQALCIDIVKGLKMRGINDPHIRFVSALMTQAREYCLIDAWLKLCCFSDSPYCGKPFEFKWVLEASKFHVIGFDHMVSALGTLFETFLDQNQEYIFNYLGTKKLKIKDALENVKCQIVKIPTQPEIEPRKKKRDKGTGGGDELKTYLTDSDVDKFNYDFHLYTLGATILKSKSVSFGKIAKLPVEEQLLDLNYVMFSAKDLRSLARQIKNSDPMCMMSEKEIEEVFTNADENITIKPRKTLQFVKQTEFEQNIGNFYAILKDKMIDETMIGGYGHNSHLKGQLGQMFFKVVGQNDGNGNPISLHPNYSVPFDDSKVPAVKIDRGDTTQIWIHTDCLFRTDRVDDLIQVVKGLNNFCTRSRYVRVPSKGGLKKVYITGSEERLVIDIKKLKSEKESIEFVKSLGTTVEMRIQGDFTRNAKLKYQILTTSQIVISEDWEEWFRKMRLEQYGIFEK